MGWMKRVWCWIVGHDWKVLRYSMRHLALVHLCETAGTESTCRRCGLHINDL